MDKIFLGCIADDFTGATDLANTFAIRLSQGGTQPIWEHYHPDWTPDWNYNKDSCTMASRKPTIMISTSRIDRYVDRKWQSECNRKNTLPKRSCAEVGSNDSNNSRPKPKTKNMQNCVS